MHLRLLLLLVCLTTAANATAGGDEHSFTLYLVRHAEKQANAGSDPALTEKGEARARHLAAWLADRKIRAVWSSDYRRTRDTAKPTLALLGLDLKTYDPRDQKPMAEKMLQERQNALVVGHSNTIPELARSLCACPVEDMDESEHGRLILITFDAAGPSLQSLQQNSLFDRGF